LLLVDLVVLDSLVMEHMVEVVVVPVVSHMVQT
jgi:hypothetical protein